jgi:hypothetical protein
MMIGAGIWPCQSAVFAILRFDFCLPFPRPPGHPAFARHCTWYNGNEGNLNPPEALLRGSDSGVYD